MTEHNEDRRQLDESMTNLPDLAAAESKRTEELKSSIAQNSSAAEGVNMPN